MERGRGGREGKTAEREGWRREREQRLRERQRERCEREEGKGSQKERGGEDERKRGSEVEGVLREGYRALFQISVSSGGSSVAVCVSCPAGSYYDSTGTCACNHDSCVKAIYLLQSRACPFFRKIK